MTRATPTHSPAPFALDGEEDCIRDAGGERLVSLIGTSVEDDRLFLKAPELLASLREIVCDAISNGATVLVAGSTQHAYAKALVDYIDGTGEA